MTDWRALCAELVMSWDVDGCDWKPQHQSRWNATVDRARAALAQPAPEVPTNEDLDELAWNWYSKTGSTWYQIKAFRAFARAVLARWGSHQPVPVSERLPGAEDCDAEGLCWWWRTDYSDEWWELLCITDAREYNARCGSARYTHWLPAHALPVPREVQP